MDSLSSVAALGPPLLLSLVSSRHHQRRRRLVDVDIIDVSCLVIVSDATNSLTTAVMEHWGGQHSINYSRRKRDREEEEWIMRQRKRGSEFFRREQSRLNNAVEGVEF